MDYKDMIDESIKFLGKNWEWIIAVLSLIGAVMVNIQNTRNYKKETQARFEVEFYDFLINVNALNDVNKELENEINNGVYKGKEAMYRSVLETKLLKYTMLLAPMVGMTIDQSGNFCPPSNIKTTNRIKVPLKNMQAINSIIFKVEQLNIRKHDAKNNEEAILRTEDLKKELVEIKKMCKKGLSEYFY